MSEAGQSCKYNKTEEAHDRVPGSATLSEVAGRVHRPSTGGV